MDIRDLIRFMQIPIISN